MDSYFSVWPLVRSESSWKILKTAILTILWERHSVITIQQKHIALKHAVFLPEKECSPHIKKLLEYLQVPLISPPCGVELSKQVMQTFKEEGFDCVVISPAVLHDAKIRDEESFQKFCESNHGAVVEINHFMSSYFASNPESSVGYPLLLNSGRVVFSTPASSDIHDILLWCEGDQFALVPPAFQTNIVSPKMKPFVCEPPVFVSFIT